MSKYDNKINEFLGAAPTGVVPMDLDNPADLEKAAQIVTNLRFDPRIIALANAGDQLSKSQTKHDLQHLIDVHDVGMQLIEHYDARLPGRLTDWQKRVEAPASLLLHDIGRAVDVNNHAAAGARIAYLVLTREGFPKQIVTSVCRNVALHRSEEVLKREFNNPIWAFTVLADKCVGDEDRVRPFQATILRILTPLRLGQINWWSDAAHDRVNFAIKKAEVICDSDELKIAEAGAFVLRLALDTRITGPEEVTTLYGKRFHACGRAAQYLGFCFRIEFNAVRFMYDKALKGWFPVKSIHVPMP